ncbi:hypothetical protein DTO271G3_6387 [Paecilomyces variotii]|nr:hypothetical protein DTO271G3_6387 [Paecilomyces variotii]
MALNIELQTGKNPFESSKDDIRIHPLQEKPSFSTLGTPGPSRPESPVQNDHDHDRNAGLATEFSTAKKAFIEVAVNLANLTVTLGASLPSGAEDSLDKAFGITSQYQITLPVSVFLIGYIFGPILFAPLSESWGRRPVYLSSFAIYTAFTLGCALAPNWPAFLFFRFMLGCGAAAPQTVSSGLFSDIYQDLGPRGRAVTTLGLTSSLGPLVGPIISGFTSTVHWKYQFWILLALEGVNWPLLVMMPETLATKRKYRQTHDKEQARLSTSSRKTEKFSFRVLTRPIRMLAEPIVFFADIFLLYQYVIFYLYFGAYPIVFQDTYGFSPGFSSLMFIPTGIGAILGVFVFLAWDAYHRRAVQQGKQWSLREEYRRLPLACLGGPLFVISQFWLGWTARPDIHWIIPALSGIPLGTGVDLNVLALNNYLADAYDMYSSSVLASSVFLRNIIACLLLTLATYPLYQNLGTAWACTLLGCLCILLVPIPFAFIRWGPSMRARSTFCQKLARNREEVSDQEQLVA